MSIDYVILAVVAVLAIGGGLFLLSAAKKYRLNHNVGDKHQSGAKHA